MGVSIYRHDGTLLGALIDPVGNIPTAIREMFTWLDNQGVITPSNGNAYAMERYLLNTKTWDIGCTAYGCSQVMYTYGLMWKYTGDDKWLAKARKLYGGLRDGIHSNDRYTMFIYNSDSSDTVEYTGGNSETPIHLFRMAELDTEMAQNYIDLGLRSTDKWIEMQNSDGSYYCSSDDTDKLPGYTSQVMAALAMAYQYTDKKTQYLTAIQNAFAFIQTQKLADGRMKCGADLGFGHEGWRGPSSEHCMTIRHIGITEKYMSTYMDVSSMTTFRQSILPYMIKCIGPEGMVRNGIETTSIANDKYGFIDHVYTTAMAIEAMNYCYEIDHDITYKNMRDKALSFCAATLYYSNDKNANAILRGAYNIKYGTWETDELKQNSRNEGGADTTYTGWIMGPIISWMIKEEMDE